MKVDTLLQKKGRAVITARPDATIGEVVALLRQHRIGCVVISSDGKHIAGLVAVRDIAYAMAERASRIRTALGSDILDAPVSRIMTHEVHCCRRDDTLRQVMMDMTRRHILHVPVVEDGELCGIVSNDDVVKYAVEEMTLENAVLRESALARQTLGELR